MGIFSNLGSSYKNFVNGYSSDHIVDKSLNSQFSINSIVDYISDQKLVKSAPVRKGHAYLTDPDGQIAAMGYMDRPYALSYDTLRDMSVKNAVIAAIINTRVNQISTFTRPARFDKSGVGYEITMRDPKVTPGESEEKEMLDLERFLEYTGYYRDPMRDSFDTFIRKITRDRLTYDQVNFEIVPDRLGRPAEFYAVDASSIRAADTRVKEDVQDNTDEGGRNTKNNLAGIAEALDASQNISDIKYVQLVDGVVVAGFGFDELAFGVANPRTDLRIQPYGFSELEALVKQVTAHLYAEDYNERYFSNGGTTKGILNLKGDADNPISPAQMEAFKRQYTAQTLGTYGAWKTPIVSIPGMEYINVQQSNREMEFEKWMNYLINISCYDPNTFITLDNGLIKKIKFIHPNDKVISHLGNAKCVKRVHDRLFTGDLITIVPSMGYFDRKMVQTFNHPIYVATNKHLANDLLKNKKVNFDWIPAKYVHEGQHLVVPRPKINNNAKVQVIHVLDYINKSKHLVYDDKKIWYKSKRYTVDFKTIAREAGVNYHTLISSRCSTSQTRISDETRQRIKKTIDRYSCKEIVNKIDRTIEVTEDVAWLLGLYTAEGCKNACGFNLNLGEPDIYRGVVDKAIYIIKQLGIDKVHVKRFDNNKNVILEVYNKALGELFESVIGKGAHNKHVPKVIIDSPLFIKKSFISGYVDGDGCIPTDKGNNSKRKSSVVIQTCSHNLASEVQYILKEFGILASVNTYKSRVHSPINNNPVHEGTSYRVQFGGKFAKEVFPLWFGHVGNTKYTRDDQNFYVSISKIESKHVENYHVYNLAVEDDQSYLANGYAVHNCANFEIDPAEVNFPNRGGAGNSGGGGLGNGGIQDRIQYSRDKGLRPLLRFVEDMINQYIIYRFSNKYIFRFVGVNAKNEQEVVTLQEKQAKVFKTINEVRAENDLDPITDGDVIEDPYFVQYTLNAQAQRLQQQQMGQEQGDPNAQNQPTDAMTPIQGSSAGRVNNISPNSSQATNESTGASSQQGGNVETISNASQLDKPKVKKSLSPNPFIDEGKFIQIDIEDVEEQK